MKNAINMLPPVYRRQRIVRRRAIQWTSVLVATLTTIAVASWFKHHEYKSLELQRAAVARRIRPMQLMLGEIKEMRQHIVGLQQYETIAVEIERQRPVLALFGAMSAAARETDGKLRVMACRVVDLQAAEVAATPVGDALPPGTVFLSGMALDRQTVATFQDALRQSELFADVKLMNATRRDGVGPELFDYEVHCEL